ncbi:aryl-alcohol dehydrogenase-like predicted oxidoreductase [Nocardiopsis arvandica]|uniref:Aryl-alcohol dehydrogenase-like predicted oxidoreductase n=1 Tax=Nocardiopsis sinuspersici TaxID=501010 RepID=A0A7Y9XAL8_9ACTN|nr:aryl-alcohol dehydrogenase-like predicted oxidoreductase [Nocardiopsis sinuspersici]
MHDVILGASGPAVSGLGLGCMGLNQSYDAPVGRREALATLEHALDLGIRFWDTADSYALGENELLIAEALTRVGRDNVVLATKFGGIFDPGTGTATGVRGDPEYVRQACDASLRRLGTDRIDLYYQHIPDPDVPVEETVAAMAELVGAGKVRYLGLSNVTAEQLRAAHAVHPIAAVQSEWSLFVRGAEKELVPACLELGVGLVPYSPLGRGFLTGTFSDPGDIADGDARQAFPWFAEGNVEPNAALLRPVRRVADEHEATPAQVALAWLAHRIGATGIAAAPIPGTKRAHRLDENAAALDLVLSGAAMKALDGIADHVAGSRRPDLPPELRDLMPDDHGERRPDPSR